MCTIVVYNIGSQQFHSPFMKGVRQLSNLAGKGMR